MSTAFTFWSHYDLFLVVGKGRTLDPYRNLDGKFGPGSLLRAELKSMMLPMLEIEK